MLRSVDKWLCGYLRSVMRRPRRVEGALHVLFCVADHFEPLRKTIGLDGVARGGVAADVARRAVRQWADDYRESVRDLRDSDGRAPCHTFFYPQEEYDPGCLEILADLTRDGLAEVEIHLHHRNDTADGLRNKLVTFRDTLRNKHGLLGDLSQRRGGRGGVGISASSAPPREVSPAYGFVHGNWALCNSRPDGDWCGVNGELGVLAETGCYADFTFPSAPSPTQPRMVNAIYRAADNPSGRGHDRGTRVSAPTSDLSERSGDHAVASGEGGRPPTSDLLLIQGPLALNWRCRKWGIVPRLEAADLSASNPPSAVRADLWVRQHIHVRGRPEWIFVKLSTHGAIPGNSRVLLGSAMRSVHEHLQSDSLRHLHYVSAREMHNIARAAEDGCTGNPAEYRDYEITAPPCAIAT